MVRFMFCRKAFCSGKKKKFFKKYLPKLNSYVVLNEYDRRDFKEKLGIDCVAMDNPRSFTSEEKTDLGQKQFFVAARFVEQKGMDLLMDASVQNSVLWMMNGSW